MTYRISSYHNGLGDSLMLTTLPEMLTKQGHEVYLLNDAEQKQVMSFRNLEIKKFVWETNPYIKKDENKSNGVWNCGDLLNLYSNTENDFIKNWERAHGLIPENSFPKIYVKPNKRTDAEAVIELSSISLKYDRIKVAAITEQIVSNFNYGFRQIMSDQNQSDRIYIPYINTLKISGLFELWDILCSCKVFVSLNSGTHSLAAAARQYNKTMLHYCIMPDKEYDSMMERKLFIYPGVTYIKESDLF